MELRDALAAVDDAVLSTLVEAFTGSMKDRWAASTSPEDRERTFMHMQGGRDLLTFTRAERQRLKRAMQPTKPTRVP